MAVGGFALAQAFVSIHPDASGFRAETTAKVKSALLGTDANVKIGVSSATVKKKVTDVKALMDTLTRRVFEAKLVVSDPGLQAHLARVTAQLVTLSKTVFSAKLKIEDLPKLEAQLLAISAGMDKVSSKVVKVHAEVEDKDALGRIALLRTTLTGLTAKLNEIKFNVNDAGALTRIAGIQARIKALHDIILNLGAGRDPLTGKFESMAQAAARLAPVLAKAESATKRFDLELLAVEVEAGRAKDTFGVLGLAAEEAGTRAIRSNRGWDTLWRSLGKHVKLFAGIMFGSIAVWHLVLDALLEIVAVALPAAIALTAFGVAGAKAAHDIFIHMQDLNTVMHATGKVIPPATSAFAKLQATVRPQVFQIFGDALTIMSKKSSTFAILAVGTGHVLENLAARFTLVATSGQGMSEFFKPAVKDLALLGDSFAHFGSILGSVLQALPGYAEILLQIGDTTLKVAADMAHMLEPLLALGFRAHGAIIWGGILTTIVIGLGKALIALSVRALAPLGARLLGLVTAFQLTARAEGVMAAAGALLERNPLVWVGIAVGALAALVVVLVNAKSAAQQFGAGLQDMVKNAPITKVFSSLLIAQEEATSKLNAAFTTLSSTQNALRHSTVAVQAGWHGQNAALLIAKQRVSDYQGTLGQLDGEHKLAAQRVAALNKRYGEAKGALGLLDAAGITSAQLLDKNTDHWKLAELQVESTVRAYRAMGATGTTLSNDIEILDRSASAQTEAVQKLNQAWDLFFTNLTGGQTSFDTFVLGTQTLRKNFLAASAAANTTSHRFQGLSEKTSLAGAAMDGLNQASLTVNQAFATSVQNAGALIDQLRNAQIGGDEFNRAIKDMVFRLVPFAKGSQEATAQLVGLAQAADYAGPVSMKRLMGWLHGTHDATKDLKKIVDEATIKEALLTVALGAQGKMITDRLLNQLDEVIVKTGGVTDATIAWGKAIANQGKSSDAAQAARKRLIDAIIETGNKAGWSSGKIAAYITKITGIPLKRSLTLVEHGTGDFKITGIFGKNTSQSAANPFLHPVAAGGLIGGGTAGKDSVAALLMPGEVVVPTHMVQTGAVDHLRGKLPGFAKGGTVAPDPGGWPAGPHTGMTPGQLGAALVSFDNAFVANFTQAMKAQIFEQSLKQSKIMNALFGGAGWPFPGGRRLSELRRVDEGQDMQYPGTKPVPVFSILPGRVEILGPDPGGFGNAYPGVQLDKPVMGFKEIYYGHVFPLPGIGGKHVSIGEAIARTGGLHSGGDAFPDPNWLEIGFWPPSWANGPAMHQLLTSKGGPGGGLGSLPSGAWSLRGLEGLWDQAGGARGLAHIMGAIALAESGGNPQARNPSGASGLWQILMPANARFVHGNVFNAGVNARAAVAIERAQGLNAWSTFSSGAYSRFMAEGGMVKSYDQGGFLPPGVSVAVNNTGKPEPVGFAKGGLVGAIHDAERTMRRHPNASRHYSLALDELADVQDQIRMDRSLLRFGRLRGHHLHEVRAELRHDERHHKELLRKMRPLRSERHTVTAMVSMLNAQEAGTADAIAAAAQMHLGSAVQRRLQARLKHDKGLEGWATWWLDKKWWDPTRRQKRGDEARVDSDLRSAIRALGLPAGQFDRGGWLPPGLSLALNNTGRAERVGSGDQNIVLEFRAAPGDAHGQYLLREVQKLVRTRGGGNVQTTFGTSY